MADTCVPAPSLLSVFPTRFQTLQSLLTFQRTADQLSSDRSKILPRYLKVSTPSMHSVSSSPVRLNVVSLHCLKIVTSFLCHRIYVFWSHRFVRWCLSSRPSVVYKPHRSQRGSGSLPSCTTAILSKKYLYMKFSLVLPAICATARQPGTRHLTIFINQGKETI